MFVVSNVDGMLELGQDGMICREASEPNVGSCADEVEEGGKPEEHESSLRLWFGVGECLRRWLLPQGEGGANHRDTANGNSNSCLTRHERLHSCRTE